MMNTKQVDLEYINNGLFTDFVPNSPAGIEAYNEMAKESGLARFLTIQVPQILQQLRSAGYSVRKAKKLSQKEIDAVVDELDSMGF